MDARSSEQYFNICQREYFEYLNLHEISGRPVVFLLIEDGRAYAVFLIKRLGRAEFLVRVRVTMAPVSHQVKVTKPSQQPF